MTAGGLNGYRWQVSNKVYCPTSILLKSLMTLGLRIMMVWQSQVNTWVNCVSASTISDQDTQRRLKLTHQRLFFSPYLLNERVCYSIQTVATTHDKVRSE